jgi:hypothetical protein
MPTAGPLRASPRRDNRPSKIVTKSPSNNVTALTARGDGTDRRAGR